LAADITDFRFVQAVGLFGKALGVIEADAPLTLDVSYRDKGSGSDDLQILFKTIVANPVALEGVMEMVHINQRITLIAGGPFFEPKVQTVGSAVTFGGCCRHGLITSD
jgi:hypothetical protein